MDDPTPTMPEARKLEVAARPAADASAGTVARDAIVQVDDLCLFYGRSQALKNITLDFPRNQVTALIGPSGCGKSTLLPLPEPHERPDRRPPYHRQHSRRRPARSSTARPT